MNELNSAYQAHKEEYDQSVKSFTDGEISENGLILRLLGIGFTVEEVLAELDVLAPLEKK